jgi:hypothetical protein
LANSFIETGLAHRCADEMPPGIGMEVPIRRALSADLGGVFPVV